MKRTKYVLLATAMMGTVAVGFELLPSNIDATNKWSWDETAGWMNWRDANGGGVIVGTSFLSGLIWGENTGWVNVGDGTPADGAQYANIDSSDFGVNIDPGSGDLSGMAWAENAGWINFSGGALAVPPNPARFDAAQERFFGFVWSENAGWINLDDALHFVGVESASSPADLDGDGDVGASDLAILLGSWGPCEGCPADFNGDGIVNAADLAQLLGAWGS